MKELIGVVASGVHSASFWLGKLKQYYDAKTGLDIFPGSLNVKLKENYDLHGELIRLEKEEYGGTVSVSMQPCIIFGRKAFLWRTDKNAADEVRDVVEIITDVKLREMYHLKDGDPIKIELPEQIEWMQAII